MATKQSVASQTTACVGMHNAQRQPPSGDGGAADVEAPHDAKKTNKPSFIVSFLCTFPHAPIIFVLTAACMCFVTFGDARDLSNDINVAGAQRLRSQQVVVASLLVPPNWTNGQHIIGKMLLHQQRLSAEHRIGGMPELRKLARAFQQNSTDQRAWSSSVRAAASSFLDVAVHNVAILEQKTADHSDQLYYIIIGLCCMEFATIGILVCVTPRRYWVHEIEAAGALKMAEARQFEAERKVWEAPAKAHQMITSILSHDLRGVSANGLINIELLKEVLSSSRSPEGSCIIGNPLTRDLVDTLLSCIVSDNTHIQYAVTSVQMISNIANKTKQTPATEEFDLGRLVHHLTTMYPTVRCAQSMTQSYIFQGDKAATYHVLHNAVRNAVKHGAAGEEITVEIGPCAAGTMISVFNLPGTNHEAMCTLQSETGLQLMDCQADMLDLKSLNVGSVCSSYQGCRDMRNVIKFLGGTAQLNFLPNGTQFKWELPGLVPVVNPCPKLNSTAVDLSQVCILCADDQNPPRLQIPSALERVGLNRMIQRRQLSDVKRGIFRDEPKLKLFGRTADEVGEPVWERVLAEWHGQPAVFVLDQNMCYGDKTVLGTNVCKSLRSAGFQGIIAIRSANESEQDKKAYKKAGANAVISKTLNTSELAFELERLMVAATVLCQK